MDGGMRSLAENKTQWKEDWFFTMTLARQKLPKNYAELTPSTGMLLISSHILDSFRKLQSFSKWERGMDINPQEEISYSTQYQEGILRYVENEYSAKQRGVPVNKPKSVPRSNLVPSTMASASGQSSFDPYDLPRDDEEYLTPNNVAEKTPGQNDCTTPLLAAARHYLNSPPEAPKNWR